MDPAQSWLSALDTALAERRVDPRRRARILLELSDHLATEPGCEERLGDPRQLAAVFADELAAERIRGSAWQVFWALAITAVALAVSQLAIGRAGGYPGVDRGLSVWLFAPAALGMFVGPQVALVAGSLAVVRAVRRRRARVLPRAEVRLVADRCRVALAGGLATVAGLGLYVADFSQRLPGWWLELVGMLAAVGLGALLVAGRRLGLAAAVACDQPGEAGDVFDDIPVPRWLRGGRWRLGLAGSALVAVLMTLFEAHAERSLVEGLERGVTEGLLAGIGFALLAGAVGLLPARRSSATLVAAGVSGAGAPAPERPPSDGERSAAESILRTGFASGRLTLQELTARLDLVHAAPTAEALRRAVADLPQAG